MRDFYRYRQWVTPIAFLLVITLGGVPATAGELTIIPSNFNGTAIAAGNWIWFTSVIRATDFLPGPTTLTFQNVKIEFTHDNVDYVLDVPDASVTFSPTATLATTFYDIGTDTWITEIPTSIHKDEFLTGVPFLVPVDFSGGISPVVWSGEIGKDTPDDDVSMCWKWGAAVYTQFSSDLNALGVKPTDDNQSSIYKNSDHAGTPENFKDFVIGGARGGGGSNYTGSWSGTACVPDIPIFVEQRSWGWLKNTFK